MNEKKGDVYLRDIHGNFHKLETKDFNEELAELSNYDNIIHSSEYEETKCNYKPFNYYQLLLTNIKNSLINNHKIKLEEGLYKFSIYLTISSEFNEKIYFFLRNSKIIDSTLLTTDVYDKIPNNIDFHFIVNINNSNKILEASIISNSKLNSISSYILYSKIN
jgi:hypothetical protein